MKIINVKLSSVVIGWIMVFILGATIYFIASASGVWANDSEATKIDIPSEELNAIEAQGKKIAIPDYLPPDTKDILTVLDKDPIEYPFYLGSDEIEDLLGVKIVEVRYLPPVEKTEENAELQQEIANRGSILAFQIASCFKYTTASGEVLFISAVSSSEAFLKEHVLILGHKQIQLKNNVDAMESVDVRVPMNDRLMNRIAFEHDDMVVAVTGTFDSASLNTVASELAARK